MAYAGETEIVRPAEGSAPAAMGPYSPAVKAGTTLYLSGQGGRDPATNELSPTAEGQTVRTLQTIGAILGGGRARVQQRRVRERLLSRGGGLGRHR